MATPLTDHKAISIKINISPNANCNRQHSYWKNNSYLLKLSEVKQEMERLINYYWVKAKSEGVTPLDCFVCVLLPMCSVTQFLPHVDCLI